jgi:hypothetical protein
MLRQEGPAASSAERSRIGGSPQRDVRMGRGVASYTAAGSADYAFCMGPDKDRKTPRQEFEVDYYTKELGRSLQRKLLQKRLEDFTDSGSYAASHHEEPSADDGWPTPREDRAG